MEQSVLISSKSCEDCLGSGPTSTHVSRLVPAHSCEKCCQPLHIPPNEALRRQRPRDWLDTKGSKGGGGAEHSGRSDLIELRGAGWSWGVRTVGISWAEHV